MVNSRENLGVVLGCVGVLLFAGTLPATRLAVGSIDPLFMTAARTTIAGCAGLTLLLATRRRPPPRELWGRLIAAALCSVIGFPVLMALAMTTVPASHGGVVLGIIPLATTAAACIVAAERPSIGFWLASFAGAAIVVIFVLTESKAQTIEAGDLFLLGTVVAGAFAYALSGRLSMTMPGWEVISWQVSAMLPLSAVAAFALWPGGLSSVPWPAWAGLAYASFVSQFFAFFVFNAGMAMAGVARVGQLMLLQPFIIVALAAPVNGEPIRLTTLAYAAAVVAAVVVGQQMRVRRG